MTMLDRFTVEGDEGRHMDLLCERCYEIPHESPWLSIPWGKSLQEVVEMADKHLADKHPVSYQEILNQEW